MGPTRSLSCSNLTPRAWKNKENVHNFTTRMYKIITMILIQCFKVFIKARYQANWPILWMIMPAWFDHLKDSFPYKEVPYKKFCLAVKKSCPPTESVNEAPGDYKSYRTTTISTKNINKAKVSTRVPFKSLVLLRVFAILWFISFLTKEYPEHTSIPND